MLVFEFSFESKYVNAQASYLVKCLSICCISNTYVVHRTQKSVLPRNQGSVARFRVSLIPVFSPFRTPVNPCPHTQGYRQNIISLSSRFIALHLATRLYAQLLRNLLYT